MDAEIKMSKMPRKHHYPNSDCDGGDNCQCSPPPPTRERLLEAIATAGKRWWPSVRARANHARMSQKELDLWQAIRALLKHGVASELLRTSRSRDRAP